MRIAAVAFVSTRKRRFVTAAYHGLDTSFLIRGCIDDI
jgi:hypothetical protein